MVQLKMKKEMTEPIAAPNCIPIAVHRAGRSPRPRFWHHRNPSL